MFVSRDNRTTATSDRQEPTFWKHTRFSFMTPAGKQPPLVKPYRSTRRVKIPHIEEIPMGTSVPHTIRQVYTSDELPDAIARNIETMKALNPTWKHKLYNENDMRNFIKKHYGDDVLSFFDRIDPHYMAAKIDLFRYLLIYKKGGAYLDGKSSFSKPIDDVILEDDRCILAKWHNKSGEQHAGFGLPKELEHMPGGEYQQWHVISVAGHPYHLQAIKNALANIEAYRPWRHGVGQRGTLRVAGPIPYSLAIDEVQKQHPELPFTIVDTKAIGLEYTIMEGTGHQNSFKNHYSTQTKPVVIQHGVDKLMSKILTLPKEQNKNLPPKPAKKSLKWRKILRLDSERDQSK